MNSIHDRALYFLIHDPWMCWLLRLHLMLAHKSEHLFTKSSVKMQMFVIINSSWINEQTKWRKMSNLHSNLHMATFEPFLWFDASLPVIPTYLYRFSFKRRVENLRKFKSDDEDCPTLVCTDLAARGLDLDVDHVVMFDFPLNSVSIISISGIFIRSQSTPFPSFYLYFLILIGHLPFLF